jgi:hypothetical protein
MAVEHDMAVDLESRGMLEANADYPKDGWESRTLERARKHARSVRYAIWSSFITISAASLVGVLIAYCSGRIGPDLPLSWSKAFGLAGGFLAAWVSLIELRGVTQTYSGEALHELVRSAFFKVLFVPGTLAAIAGLLW